MRHLQESSKQKVQVVVFVVIAFVLVLMGRPCIALEPPRSGELERLKKSGEIYDRQKKARELGNHRIDSYILKKALARAKREALAQKGVSPSIIEHAVPHSAPPSGWSGMPTTGPVKMFALLIDFSDYPAFNTKTGLHSALFGDGSLISANDFPYESLSSYYRRSSYNRLDLSQGITLGWYRPSYTRASMPMSYTAREQLIKEAITYYKARGENFSRFDNDGDGTIDYFAVIWTGPDNGWANFWWGYYTSFSDWTFTVDGKRLGRYSWQWEYNSYGDYTGPFSPETVIHETGHALGIPDYYDYDDTIGPDGGVGYLDMMDGVWGDHNAFSKWILDWLTPTIVASGSQQIPLSPSSFAPQAVMIMPGATSDPFKEFFIVQNRDRIGNDTGYPADGMLVWHVDATLDSGGYNYLYNNSYTDHKLLKLMEADGLERIENYKAWADAEMYYQPGGNFGPLSAPSSRDYYGFDTGVSVAGISRFSPTMSATFSVMQLAPVADFYATPVSGQVPLPVTFADTSTGTVTSYQWDFGDGTGSASKNPVHTYASPGKYSVTLVVTGPGGNSTKTRQDYIVALPSPPTVSINEPVDGATFIAPASIAISANATAGIGAGISRVDFYAGSLLIGSSTTAPYSCTWSGVAKGEYSLVARVIDSYGQSISSEHIAINVTEVEVSGSWTSQDIGFVGIAGDWSDSADTFTIEGAGDDIWGTADAFRFVYRELTGDGEITAHVPYLENTHESAKAGVMIRETLTAGSRNAIVEITPGNGIIFQRRHADGNNSVYTPGPFVTAPVWIKLVRSGQTIRAYSSPDGSNWTIVGTDTVNMSTSVYIGLALTSHDNSQLCTAMFDRVHASGSNLSQQWSTTDIGQVGVEGSVATGTFTVKGAGEDIWGTADSFRFVYQQLAGDGEIVARVASLDPTHVHAKAGVMIRESLDSISGNALMEIKPGYTDAIFQRRKAAGALSLYTSGPYVEAPYWVRLVRSSDTMTGYISSDGKNWTFVGSDTFTMQNVVYVGLAVTSHDTTRLCTATFDNIRLSGWTQVNVTHLPDFTGVFRRGGWYLDKNGSRTWDTGDTSLSFGNPGDKPVAGRWNGANPAKIGVFRGGAWYLDGNGNGLWDVGVDLVRSFGIPTDLPVVGDWTGNGTTNIGVFRDGAWFLDLDGNGIWGNADTSHTFGISGDKPVTGDWNGSGTTKIGVVRGNTWYLDINGNGSWDDGIDTVTSFGLPSDVPIAGDWTGTGITRIGVVRGGSSWFLDINGNGAWDDGADATIQGFGIAGDLPVTGSW